MGAWGHGPFDNDAAGDWVDELTASGSSAIDDAFERVLALEPSDYLELDDASAALAAAEVVCSGHGGAQTMLSDEARDWLADNRAGVLSIDRSRARRATQRVYELSELRELWDENGDDTEWHQYTRHLLERLA
jgi:hypothetical protein